MTRSTVTTVTVNNDATPSTERKITFASDEDVKAAELLADAVYYLYDRYNPGDIGLSEEEFDTTREKLGELCKALYEATHP